MEKTMLQSFLNIKFNTSFKKKFLKIKYNQPITNEQTVELDLCSHLYAFVE